MIEFRTHSALTEIPRAEWDALVGQEGPPHLQFEFLRAFEKTACVGPGTGWAPAHITLRRAGALLAAAPAYVKGNSSGEFVFDHSWANFCHEQIGQEYYPKLIVAVPFTPATGPRLLIAPGQDANELSAAFAGGLRQFCSVHGLSSAHVLFPAPEEAERYARAGMPIRKGIQYHWTNPGYATFEDFLQRFSSKRRYQIRRERRAIEDQGLALEVFTGSDITSEIVDHAFEYYLNTVEKHFYGQQYLNRAFFEEVCSNMSDNVLIVLARESGSRRFIAGAFNLIGGGAMYGRYWGATQERNYLHFNVCYYKGVEECIARGLKVFEPGAGGEHKLARGFEATETFSAHHVDNPKFARVVYDFLARERDAVSRYLQEGKPILKELSELR